MASKEQTGPTSEGSRGHVGQCSFTRVDTRVDTRARASHPQTLIRNWDPTVSDGHKCSCPCRVCGGLPPVALIMVSLLTAPIPAFRGPEVLGLAPPDPSLSSALEQT